MPLLTFTGTSARAQATAAQQRFSAIAFESANNSATFNPTSAAVGIQVSGCSFKNTGTGRSLQVAAASAWLSGLWCETSSTTLPCVAIGGAGIRLANSTVIGGSVNVDHSSNANATTHRCILRDAANDAVLVAGNVAHFVTDCTIYNAGQDGVRRTGGTTTAAQVTITNTVFSVIGGYAFNNLGSDLGIASLLMNGGLFHSVTSGQVNGVSDPINENAETDSSSPFVDAPGGDFSLVTTSNGYGTAIPGTFLRTSLDTVLDRGAVQRLRTGGGGGETAFAYFG
jgi:hypothetical protein